MNNFRVDTMRGQGISISWPCVLRWDQVGKNDIKHWNGFFGFLRASGGSVLGIKSLIGPDGNIYASLALILYKGQIRTQNEPIIAMEILLGLHQALTKPLVDLVCTFNQSSNQSCNRAFNSEFGHVEGLEMIPDETAQVAQVRAIFEQTSFIFNASILWFRQVWV